MPEAPVMPAPSAKTPEPAQEIPVVPKVEKIASVAPIAEEVKPVQTEAAPKAISIKPLKRKIKKKVPPGRSTEDIERKRRLVEQKKALARQQALEAQSRRLQEEAKRQREIAEAEAKLAAEQALSMLKRSLKAEAAAGNTSQRSSAGGGSTSVLEAQYFSSIFDHLHKFWALPKVKQWDPQLHAIVVITIGSNGKILKHHFEKRSGDRVFDQFVNRTIQDADPLPGIPKALRKNQFTIGLRFKPGQIQ